MTVRKVLGAGILALPFVGILAFVIAVAGVFEALLVIAIAAILVGAVCLGVSLLMD